MIITYDILDAPAPTKELFDSFSSLADDQYVKHKYCFRKRSFAKGSIDSDLSIRIGHNTHFSQDLRINNYLGGVSRVYPKACAECVQYVQLFLRKHSALMQRILGSSEMNIGIHQIRITAEGVNIGYPVPEGYHQDGVDYVIIIPIYQNNIWGGINSIHYGSANGPEILDTPIGVGSSIILNDRMVYHYATPVCARYADMVGVRDSIIVTLQSKEP